jgi:hypothetical protein
MVGSPHARSMFRSWLERLRVMLNLMQSVTSVALIFFSRNPCCTKYLMSKRGLVGHSSHSEVRPELSLTLSTSLCPSAVSRYHSGTCYLTFMSSVVLFCKSRTVDCVGSWAHLNLTCHYCYKLNRRYRTVQA